jgi:hypothetical protein
MNSTFNKITLFFKSHSLSKNVLFTSAIIFLLIGIYLTASWGLTQATAVQPSQLMKSWLNKKQPFSEKKWRIALNTMHAAVESNPNNAQNHFDLARLYEWYAYQRPIWEDETIAHRTKAIEYYKKTLELRPTWAKAWVNFAMSKTFNMEFGDEVKTALLNGMKYGVWEHNVFHKVLWISMANWKGMPKEIQQQVKSLIKVTVNKRGKVPRYIQLIAKRFKWQGHLDQIINEVFKSSLKS